MDVASTILSGFIGSVLSAIIVGVVTYIISKNQMKSLERSHQEQLKAYEENGKVMVEVLKQQQGKILDLEEKIIALMKVSKEVDQRKLALREREIMRRENKDTLERLGKIGKFFGIIE